MCPVCEEVTGLVKGDEVFTPGSRRGLLALLMAVVVGLPLLTAPAQAASSQVSWTRAKVVRWIDGDTVRTTKGTIRLVGVDTPERGRCGAVQATRIAQRTAPKGTVVRLGNPRSVDNRDRYDRRLRYVVNTAGKVDIAAKQIRKGSKARYDSRDGYDWHPKQARYRTLDRKHRDHRCSSATSGGGTSGNPYQDRANRPVSASNPDLDCGDIPSRYKPVRIHRTDYHRLDGDGDGWGCEA